MHKILITGHRGYIASSLYTNLKDTYDVTVLGRDDLDLTDSFRMNEWFTGKHFDVVIHTAITGGHRLIPDDATVMDANLRMYYNLLDNQKSYTRFLNIGSGAELHNLDTPYGLSKSVIAKSIAERDNFYNIRAYAVFDENELPTRFIKMSITNYIKKEPIKITLNKYMDFFYMKDFVQLIKYYITAESPDKLTECAYSAAPSLKKIANKINSLSNYQVDIQFITEGTGDAYGAPYPRTNLPIELCGWEKGIELTYEALCNR